MWEKNEKKEDTVYLWDRGLGLGLYHIPTCTVLVG